MVEEVLVALNCRPGGFYVDGTVGEGGHAAAILDRTAPNGILWGLDRDAAVLENAAARLGRHASRFHLFHRSYAELGELLKASGVPGVDGIVLDLGLSSRQLEYSQRGFSFQRDEPLDMRFDPQSGLKPAARLLNSASQALLEKIFRDYGEEPLARKIARLVVQARRQTPIQTTQQLVEIVQQAKGPGGRRWGRHPATRVFQAIRIAVNRELDELEAFLNQVPAWLLPGGRLAVISYHSLEDRQVKQRMAAWERAGIMSRQARKPLAPSREEVRRNPRARSAKLRAATRSEAAFQ